MLKDDEVIGLGIIPSDITTGTKALQASADPTPPFTLYDVIGKRIDIPARPITIYKDASIAQTEVSIGRVTPMVTVENSCIPRIWLRS